MSQMIKMLTFVLILLGMVGRAEAQETPNERDLYVRLEQVMSDGNYLEAKRLAHQLVFSFPDSPNTPQARYWLACLESGYREAMVQLQSIVRDSGENGLATAAQRRMMLLMILEDQVKDAPDVLRDAERRERSKRIANEVVVNSLRLDLAQAHLALGREGPAGDFLSQIRRTEGMSDDDQQRLGFYEALVLWRRGREKDFWQKVIDFESRFPRSEYIPSLLWTASQRTDRWRSRRDRMDQELLHEIIDFYPHSPEAFLARQALGSG